MHVSNDCKCQHGVCQRQEVHLGLTGGVWVLGPPPAAFPDTLLRSWTRNRMAFAAVIAPKWDGGVMCRGSSHCASWLAGEKVLLKHCNRFKAILPAWPEPKPQEQLESQFPSYFPAQFFLLKLQGRGSLALPLLGVESQSHLTLPENELVMLPAAWCHEGPCRRTQLNGADQLPPRAEAAAHGSECAGIAHSNHKQ